ncbi:5726_t:CDS:2 [Diversispora eburnea]|uniref:5726_t:CDS:1 n=1 Tax=Diversispora eburnea TaxID=1213867 RepID=A0A9N9ATJ9_9GLOM|nr:5726_t:CDS:2 [Diversispora eburnea]
MNVIQTTNALPIGYSNKEKRDGPLDLFSNLDIAYAEENDMLIANFATASRLLKCAINEGLVYATYHHLENNITGVSGVIYVLPKKKNFKNGKEGEEGIIERVTSVDPWDMIKPIQERMMLPCLESSNVIREIGASELMKILGKWLKLNDNILNMICEELESSVKYQEWEQSIIEGHPTHPMHKSRKAVKPIPEILPGTYDFETPTIRFVKISQEKVMIRGPINEILLKLINIISPKPFCSPNYILIPVHELQLPNIIKNFPYVEILSSKYSLKSISQASLRTVLFTQLPEYAFKLSLGIKVTSALRTITPWSTHIGTELVPIFEKMNIDKNILHIANEIASIVSNERDYNIAKHLSCIVRYNINDQNSKGERIIICAALTERDESGKTFLPPALDNGFSFEAHPQNVLARFNDTKLNGFVIRDFGGVRFHQETLRKSIGQRINVLEGSATQAKNLIEQELVDGKCFLRMKYEGLYRDYIHQPNPNLILYKSEDEGVTLDSL